MRRNEATLRNKWKIKNLTLQSQLRLSKFLTFIRFLRDFLTSRGSRKFSMCDMKTHKLFKSLPQIKALRRTSNHDHTMRKREATLQKKWKIQNLTLQSQLRLSKFLTFIRFLRNFSTSSGSRKFSMGYMITTKLFKSLLQIRALQRTSNHNHTMRRNEAMPRNKWKMQNLTLQSQLRLSKFLTFINF